MSVNNMASRRVTSLRISSVQKVRRYKRFSSFALLSYSCLIHKYKIIHSGGWPFTVEIVFLWVSVFHLSRELLGDTIILLLLLLLLKYIAPFPHKNITLKALYNIPHYLWLRPSTVSYLCDGGHLLSNQLAK